MAHVRAHTLTTVLIVENEAIIRLELADQLRDMGFIALEAADADEAIALLESCPGISVMFTDVTMPGSMDGLRLAHHVRLRWPPMKIIVASGKVDAQLAALPEGSIFLPKPYRPEALAEALKSAPRQRKRTPAPRL